MQRKRKSHSSFISSESSFTNQKNSLTTATMTSTISNSVKIGAVISIFSFVIAILMIMTSSNTSITNQSSSWLSTATSKVRALQTTISRTPQQHDNNNNDSFLVQQNQERQQQHDDFVVQSPSEGPQQQLYHIPMLTSHQVWTRRRKERRILRERRKTERTRQLQQQQQNNLQHEQQQLLRYMDTKEERDRHFDPHDVRNHIIGNNHDDDDDEDHSLDLAALYQGFGTHYVDLWIGTPVPQRQTLIVDTGSSLTAFPCVECDPIKCGLKYHTATAFFDPALSETFDKLTCDKRGCNAGKCQHHSDSKHGKDSEGYCSLHQGYSEGSEWRAYEFMDYTYVGGHHFNPVNVTLYEDNDEDDNGHNTKTKTKTDIAVEPTYVLKFETLATMGCQTSITGLFKTQLADGIMGMDKARKHAFWNQMYQFGSIPTPNFSLCFAKSNLIDTDGSIAGIMTLGGSDPALHSRPMKYAKELRSSSSSYYVRLETMYLFNSNGQTLEMMLPLDDDNSKTKGSSTSKQQHQEEEGTTTLEQLKKSGKLVELEGLEQHQLNTQHGAMVDSGTTSTYFPRVVTGPFKKAWKEMTGFEFGDKSKEMNDMSYGDAMSLPTVVLQLEGVDEVLPGETEHAVDHDEYDDDDTYADDDNDDDERRQLQSKSRIKSKTGSVFVSITPSQYVSFTPKDYYNGDGDEDENIDPYYEYDNDVRGKVRFRITLNHQKATLGASTLIGHDVMFDNTGGMGGGGRIGFAPSNCNYASLGYTHVLPISPQMAQHMKEERDAKTYQLSNETLKLLLVTLIVFVLLLVAMIGNCTYQAYQYGKGETNSTARTMATALERMQRRQANANGTTQPKRVRQSESSISNNGETFEGDFDHDDDFHDDETENEEMIQLTSAAVSSAGRSTTD